MPYFNGPAYLQAKQNVWGEDEKRDKKLSEVAGSFGKGYAEGKDLKRKSTMEAIAEKRKSYYGYTQKLFDNYQPVRMINGKIEPLSIQEQNTLYKDMINDKPLPEDVFLLDKDIEKVKAGISAKASAGGDSKDPNLSLLEKQRDNALASQQEAGKAGDKDLYDLWGAKVVDADRKIKDYMKTKKLDTSELGIVHPGEAAKKTGLFGWGKGVPAKPAVIGKVDYKSQPDYINLPPETQSKIDDAMALAYQISDTSGTPESKRQAYTELETLIKDPSILPILEKSGMRIKSGAQEPAQPGYGLSMKKETLTATPNPQITQRIQDLRAQQWTDDKIRAALQELNINPALYGL